MKSKIVFGVLALTVALGAISPAFAGNIPAQDKQYLHCRKLEVGNEATTKLVRECAKYIVGEGIIQSGPAAGKVYKYEFKDAKFASYSRHDVKLNRVSHWFGLKAKHKYAWSVNGKSSMRTKEIAPEDLVDTLQRAGLKFKGKELVKIG